jgi:hypothetical protein
MKLLAKPPDDHNAGSMMSGAVLDSRGCNGANACMVRSLGDGAVKWDDVEVV